MEGGAIVPSHHCILLIRVTTFIEDLCIIPSKTLYTEEDPHQGSKRSYMFVYVPSLH